MARDNDYRNTIYCPVLDKVEEQKNALEKEIKLAFPRTKIIYNKVKERNSEYHKKFAKIYNNKCAYCGAMWGLLPVESFEVDHFFNEASFPDTTAGRTEAGRMINLAWACISCNRGKRGITIKPRTHQIRVHMASLQHPLLGDSVYGPAKSPYKLQGQTLHAMTIGFIHPSTGGYMEFSAPLPAYFEELLHKLP